MTEQSLETKLQEISKAPRVTLDRVEQIIKHEYYFTAGDGVHSVQTDGDPDFVSQYDSSLDLLTFCVLVLDNGFTVTGESACASPENFNAEIGRKIARDNAKDKIWALEGYVLKQKLFEDICNLNT